MFSYLLLSNLTESCKQLSPCFTPANIKFLCFSHEFVISHSIRLTFMGSGGGLLHCKLCSVCPHQENNSDSDKLWTCQLINSFFTPVMPSLAQSLVVLTCAYNLLIISTFFIGFVRFYYLHHTFITFVLSVIACLYIYI